MLDLIVIQALAAAFSILLATKLGLLEKGILYAPKHLSQALSCELCLAFWTNTIAYLCGPHSSIPMGIISIICGTVLTWKIRQHEN